ncbi:hypothetical protein EFK50_07895 [Nocardioides marmoriginsengisoli]|uniref:Uncharacterized protein n=1 Tax=Nocardioides marmoriginsengisoli TaxID=661483 RepID=A0A3N0CKV9_9ACTN|nr:hypothetical protein [Nocardioides marmoriginsengisoli]RNL63656.1 hypothetical protein EFK50_07895 [Nocardioides marmoriginsengisoli]
MVWDGTNSAAGYTPFTPVWTAASGSPAIGSGGVLSMRYNVQPGNLVTVDFYMLLGTTGLNIGTGTWTFTVPIPALNNPTSNIARGNIWFRDVSASLDYPTGFVILPTASTLNIRGLSGTGTSTLLGSTAPVVPAAGDWISGQFTYEAA